MPEILSIGELLDLGNSANMSAYIPYSGLEYNASGAISGISGSAIAGGIESSVVSSIVSSMVSGKADQSAVEDCCSAMSAEVSAKLDATASSLFQPSGNYQPSGDYVFESSYSSFTSEVTNNITSISSTVSGLTGDYLEKSASSMFAPSGEYAYESSLSSYLPSSASSNFAPSADYAYNSALSSYIPYSSVAGADSQITSINGSAIGGSGSEFTGVVTDDTLTGNGLPDSALGVDNYNVLFDSSLYSSLNGDNVTIGVQPGIYQPSGDYYPASNPSGFISSVDLSNYATTGYVDSSVSGKLDSSASSGFYPNDNPSGFITGVDLSNYATTAYVDSSVSGKQDTLTFAYDVDKISAINGSALAVGGGGATGDYVEKSATEVAIGSYSYATDYSFAQGYLASSNGSSFAQGNRNSANSRSLAQGYQNSASANSLAQGQINYAEVASFAQGAGNSATSYAFAQGNQNSSKEYSIAQGDRNSAIGGSFAQGYQCQASSRGFAWGNKASATGDSVAMGRYVSAAASSTAFGHYNLKGNGLYSPSAAFVIGDGTANTARHDLMVVTKNGEITMYSSTADTTGTGVMSSIRSKMDSSAIQFVAASSDATANGVLYILTGNS